MAATLIVGLWLGWGAYLASFNLTEDWVLGGTAIVSFFAGMLVLLTIGYYPDAILPRLKGIAFLLTAGLFGGFLLPFLTSEMVSEVAIISFTLGVLTLGAVKRVSTQHQRPSRVNG